MLKHLTGLSKKPCVLGIDWQLDKMHMVLLGCANKADKANKFNNIDQKVWLGQWQLTWPLLSASSPMQTPAAWQEFLIQLAALLGTKPLYINVGIPNRLCTWLHCPVHQLKSGANPVNLQLNYHRVAAAALNIEPANLTVCHVQLAPNLSFLVVTKRHYEEQIEALIKSLHSAIKGSVIGAVEPQGLTQVPVTRGVDKGFAMAWFMAHKLRRSGC